MHGPPDDRPRPLFEVARAQQLRPAGVDLQEHLVYDLLRGRTPAEVDLRVGVERLLVAQVEGLEVQRKIQRNVHGLGQPQTVLRLQDACVLPCVVVAHARLPKVGNMAKILSSRVGGDRRQLVCAESLLA